MIPTEFLLNPEDPTALHLHLRRMVQEGGAVLWAIYHGQRPWDREDGAFVYEPQNSRRTAGYLRAVRFTWEEAQAEAVRALRERRAWWKLVTGEGE